ncbi:hypothetical protein OPQ81_007384 [Rhizoctonia solani]|nr:hypothetical protein OPQ81_007384 [Rhizoctonia solani]
MLLALPVIAAIFVSYIQFTFIRRDGYEWLRPLVWDALEDIKGIMRRRIPLWMQPLPAATTKLTLPAPIATDDLPVATTNQTLMNITQGKVPIFGFDNTLFDVPARIVLRLQEIRGTSLFYPLCGATLFLCVAGFYTLWALLSKLRSFSVRNEMQEDTGRLKSTTIVHSVAPQISALASFSEPISPNPPVTDLRKSASGAARVPGFVTPGLPMTPYVPESCLEPPVLGSSFPPATASESTWEELRVPSLIKSTDALDVDPSGRWHPEVMMIGSGPCYSVQSPVVPKEYGRRNTTSRTLPSTGSNRAKESDTGISCSKPREFSVIGEVPNSQSPVIPLITVEEYQEPSKTPTVGSSNCAGEPVECRLETGLHPNVLATHAVAMDDSAEGSSAIGQWAKDEPESTLGDLDVSKLGTSFSIVCVRSGDSTPRAAPETTERPESSVGSTPDLLHIQTGSRDLEESLVSRSTTPATWVGFVALRDSLIHLCSSSTTQRSISGATDGITPSTMQDMDDFSTVNLLDHDSVWINDHEDSLEPLTSIDSTHVVSNTSNGDKINTHGHSELDGSE